MRDERSEKCEMRPTFDSSICGAWDSEATDAKPLGRDISGARQQKRYDEFGGFHRFGSSEPGFRVLKYQSNRRSRIISEYAESVVRSKYAESVVRSRLGFRV